ncbi:hypothetical protein JCM9534A_02750 [Catenuloplanes indicus JCM 9534]
MFEGAQVMPWPENTPRPQPPPGTAGIAVWVRRSRHDPNHWGHGHGVGVDDRPLFWGLGRMVTFVEPGEHRAEVRNRGVVSSARTVRVAAGEVAELEFWTPASFDSTARGVLAPAPARHRIGSGSGVQPAFFGTLVACGAVAVLLPDAVPQFVLGVTVAAMLVLPVLAVWAYVAWKRAADRRYRREISAEARDTPGAAMFLGEGTAPGGLTDAAHGAVVVTCVLKHHYRWNDRSGLMIPDQDPNAWVPAPTLTVDGRPQPFGFLNWAYRLPAGPHTLTVTPRPPVQAPIGEQWRHIAPPPVTPVIDAPPGTVRVDITAGQVTHLTITVEATTAVQFVAVSASAPTVLTGFTATVTSAEWWTTTSCTSPRWPAPGPPRSSA